MNSDSGFFTAHEAYIKGTDLYLMTGATTSRTSRMYINQAGNVGIGDNVGTGAGWYPDCKFHVIHTTTGENEYPLAKFEHSNDASIQIKGSGEIFLDLVLINSVKNPDGVPAT